MVSELLSSYQIVGFLISRGIGFAYLLAFIVFFRQYSALVGSGGLDPVDEREKEFWEFFSIFNIFTRQKSIDFFALVGVVLSFTAFIGVTELLGIFYTTLIWLVLWILFTSFVNSGGVFTKPGWEIILAETGFIAIFIGTLSTNTSQIVIWLFRWILFRMMLGSAIVKLRGGVEWRKLEALGAHFESQPFPGPLSRKLYNLPEGLLKSGSLCLQISMLILPFFYFLPQPYAASAGMLTILIQLIIFISGNYAWLNVIVSVLALSTFNDKLLTQVVNFPITGTSVYPYQDLIISAALMVAILSFKPISNFFSRNPWQNTSYNPLNLANSYGAFPEIKEKHLEIVIEGKKRGEWQEYKSYSSFRNPEKNPVQIAPYHHMMEYLMYFYVHKEIEEDKWLNRLLKNILDNDGRTIQLFRNDPFSGDSPNVVRAVKYEYRFTDGNEEEKIGQSWVRQKIGILSEESKD